MFEMRMSETGSGFGCYTSVLLLLLIMPFGLTSGQNDNVGKVGPSVTLNPWSISNYSNQDPPPPPPPLPPPSPLPPPLAEASVQNPDTTKIPSKDSNSNTRAPIGATKTGNNNNNNNATKTPEMMMMTGTPMSNCSGEAAADLGCRNGGSCYGNGSAVWCLCSPGWTGTRCDTDVDECNPAAAAEAQNKCSSDATCANSEGGYSCACRPGYTGDGYTCTFINQCTNETCPRATCFSQLNSYRCICDSGWNGDNCSQDINECESGSPVCMAANSKCVNTNGSYTCNCFDGYYQNSLNTCTENRLWRYGVNNVTLAKSRNSKMAVDIPGGFPYYGQVYYQFQVSINGYVTLGSDDQNLSSPVNYRGQFPSNVPMFAPYWSDIETARQNSSMVTVDVYNFWNSKLNLKSSEIYALLVARFAQYAGNAGFEPWFAVVITWLNVVPYPAKVYSGFENATFQLVLATSGSRSVAFVNYAAGQMQWNRYSDNRTIVIGMTDGVNLRYNFTGDVYRPDQNAGIGTGRQGQFFFNLGDPVSNPRLPCLQWYQSPNDALTSSNTLVPCPCSLEQALNDLRFVNDSTGELCVRHRLANSAGVNLCCYDRASRALIVGIGGGYLRSNGAEMDGKKKCCVDTDLCQVFFMKQMSDNCQKYASPFIGGVWGDPYISPFAGEDFSFNGKGEYHLFRLASGLFLLQGRFEQNSNAKSANATTLTAVAVKFRDQPAVEVQWKDGALRVLTGGQIYSLPWNGNFSGAIVESSGTSSIQFHFECDVVLQISVVTETLRLFILLPKSLPGWSDAIGLLVKKCSGAFIEDSSESDAYKYFSACLVTKSESLFFYAIDGYYYDSINDQNFAPTFFPSSAVSPSVASWCGSSKSCVREWVKTTMQNRALAAKAFEEGVLDSRSKLTNFPPAFSPTQPSSLFAVFDQELNVTLNVSDPEGKAIRLRVDTVINQTEWQLYENVFTWRPSTVKYNVSAKVFLQFYASDDVNSTSLYWPFVHLCPCPIERGRCAYNYPSKLDMKTPQGRLVMGRCVCLPGWTGDSCSQAKDACSPNFCFPGVNCTSNPNDTMTGYTCASCPSGMVKDGNWCYDVNECLTPPGLACSSCVNLLGSYICSCNQGYNLSPDNKTCIDVNECTQGSRCLANGQYCHNIPGSYECRCRSDQFINGSNCVYAPIKFGGKIRFKTFNVTGKQFLSWMDSMSDKNSEHFKLIMPYVESLMMMPFASEVGFVGIKATQLQKGSIMALFDLFFKSDSLVNATYLDGLLAKYLLSQNCRVNGPDCIVSNLVGVDANMSNVYDKDLCANSADNMCDLKTMDCRTENGQVLCGCKTGFERIADYIEACEDIDECFLETDNCNMNVSTCENTPGSFMCLCEEGFEMNNGSCTDVCRPNPCANNGLCVTRGYEFVCDCVGIWTGLNCTEENPEAVKLRKIAIGIGVGLGILCLGLIVGLVIACVRILLVRRSPLPPQTMHPPLGTPKGGFQ